MLEDIKKKAGIVGQSKVINEALDEAARIAETSSHVLILGEPGTEKKEFAKFIHLLSERASNSMTEFNCDIHYKFSKEVELFGHEKGVVKGSMSYRRPGLFESANMGSVFLESISQLSSGNIQKIKKAMVDGSVQRIGADMTEKIDTRVFLDIELDIRGKLVLPSLKKRFAKLDVVEIVIPPLRKRPEDIPSFCNKQLSSGAHERLYSYDWPGNIHQLLEVVRNSELFCLSETLHAEDLLLPHSDHFQDFYSALPEPEQGFDMPSFLSKVEKQLIIRAIYKAGFNLSEASRILGVSAKTVRKFWEEYGPD
ncbi:MAG: sigma-54-dependent Fis family transcriptional regulator [FCB group bacterium]|nr:sigma-54-dependent Fis family transcriptional regulator [FCB group bacterium]MBL7120345.1 sigma-54-dependent Fis family transcriptional regulator [Candidatus Neomarinimicrobiota bacterium]